MFLLKKIIMFWRAQTQLDPTQLDPIQSEPTQPNWSDKWWRLVIKLVRSGLVRRQK